MFQFLIKILSVFLFALAGLTQSTFCQEKPTSVQRGIMSPKQRAHSKLFQQKYGGNKKLFDLSKSKGDIRVIIGPPMPYMNPRSPVPSFTQYFQNMSCEADIVVIGDVQAKASQLTESEDFIFTDYEVNLKEVLKNNALFYLESNSAISITRPGGAVEVEGRTVKAEFAAYQPLEVGKQYLLFLNYIPESGAYEPTGSNGSFLLQEGKTSKLTEERFPVQIEDINASAFVAEIRKAVADAVCRNQRGGF